MKSGAAVIVIVTGAVRGPLTPVATPLNTPVKVIGAVPGNAVTVTICEPPAGTMNVGGLNVRLGLLGAVTVTIPVNPLIGVTPTASMMLWLAAIDAAGGVTVRMKSGPAAIVTAIAAVRVPGMPGAVPLNTPICVLGTAVLAAAIITTCEPPAGSVNVIGEKVRSRRFGELTVTVPPNPLTPVAVTVTDVLCPAGTETSLGVTVRRKSGPAATLIVTVVVFGVPVDGLKVNVTG